MEGVGGLEVSVPLLNPERLWKRSGRDVLIGDDLMRLRDRTGRRLVLAPSHEEAMVELVRASLGSYRDFPVLLYQYQTKVRDEAKPRCGLVRAREFEMKDAYSFHRSFTDLNNFFPKMFAAYQRIFQRCGVSCYAAAGGVGYMGGDKSFEFVAESECGDDQLVRCPHCGYRANADVAAGRKEIPSERLKAAERVHTPGCKTIASLVEYLGIPRRSVAKPVVYATHEGLVMAVVRGDQEVSPEKLMRTTELPLLRLAGAEELEAAGLVPGSFSPMGYEGTELEGLHIIADETIAASPNLVIGANEEDYHIRNANFGRDFECRTVADIARVAAGDRCVHCGEALESASVMELGHIFRLGDYYAKSLELSVRGEHGERVYPFMGSYGIGVGRLLTAIVEQHHDERGIVWPRNLAPFRFYLMSIGHSGSVRKQAEQLYQTLGGEVLLDDRDDSISTKLKDADLLGIPYRIVVSQQTLEEGTVEIAERDSGCVSYVPLGEVPELVRDSVYEGCPE
jgi:prolyl-tRNA synthetase